MQRRWPNVAEKSLTIFAGNRGDQIGRIFSQWVFVSFGQFLEDYRSNPHFWATLFNG
jgi:hypothetical protein